MIDTSTLRASSWIGVRSSCRRVRLSVLESRSQASRSSSAWTWSATRSTTAANSAALEPKFWKITGSLTPTSAATSDTFPARYPAPENTSTAAARIDSRRWAAFSRVRRGGATSRRAFAT